jgi:uncharacterized protein YjbI with pentapeptide repeats
VARAVRDLEYPKSKKVDSTMAIIRNRYNLSLPIFQSEDISLRATVIHAVCAGQSLSQADLRNANLNGANLRGTCLAYADLGGAVLRRAFLELADLRGVVLHETNLHGADLHLAKLNDANLRNTVMPDGRLWEKYLTDPLAEICGEPAVRKRAIAAWSKHTWGQCPMSAAHGWNDYGDVPKKLRIAVNAFVALYDSLLLPKPKK